jgi:hypothetical protein
MAAKGGVHAGLVRAANRGPDPDRHRAHRVPFDKSPPVTLAMASHRDNERKRQPQGGRDVR